MRIAQRPGGARPKLSIRSAAQWPGGSERGGRGAPAGRSLRWPNSRYIGRITYGMSTSPMTHAMAVVGARCSRRVRVVST